MKIVTYLLLCFFPLNWMPDNLGTNSVLFLLSLWNIFCCSLLLSLSDCPTLITLVCFPTFFLVPEFKRTTSYLGRWAVFPTPVFLLLAFHHLWRFVGYHSNYINTPFRMSLDLRDCQLALEEALHHLPLIYHHWKLWTQLFCHRQQWPADLREAATFWALAFSRCKCNFCLPC